MQKGGQTNLFSRWPAMVGSAFGISLGALATQAADPAPATKPAGAVKSEINIQLTPDVQPQYWFGVAVENIPPAFAKQLKLNPEQGVMVSAVFEGSPAAKAGPQPEDILIELNRVPLTSQEELARAANPPNASNASKGGGK